MTHKHNKRGDWRSHGRDKRKFRLEHDVEMPISEYIEKKVMGDAIFAKNGGHELAGNEAIKELESGNLIKAASLAANAKKNLPYKGEK